MTHIITGSAGSGKTTELYKLLKKDSGNRILLVPDQFVFESERRVAEETDEKTGSITVTGFNSLSESILKKYCPRKIYADATAKTAIMSGAVRALCDDMKFYGNAAKKNGFVEMCLSAVGELKSAGITPDLLLSTLYSEEKNISEKLPAHLAQKLSDISALYSSYDKRLTEKYDDRQDNLTLAADVILKNDCFDSNTTIYIDGFDSFSGAQKKFLRALADKNVNFVVALCTDESGAEVFATCDSTKRLFDNGYAPDCGKPDEIKYTRLYGKAPRYKNSSLKALRDFLQTGVKAGTADSNGITMGYSSGVSGEADFVCANIRKLVRCEGYRYSDIAVICASPAKYKDAVSSAAARYGVPIFVDLPVPISEKPMLRFFDALLKAADNPTGTNILRYIRSGFVRIPSEKKQGKTVPLTMRERHLVEQHLMEEYAECWDLKRKKWDKPMPHITNASEQRVEEIRIATVTPLVEFAKSVQGVGGKELVKRFTAFLFDKVDIGAAIQGKCQDNTTRELRYVKELTEEYNQLWRTVSEMLTSLYETLDDTPMTLGEFSSLLRNCASRISISRTPNVLDSVLFGDPARTRSREVKAVFVMGAADGAFPDIYPDTNSIFTSDDIERLAENDLELDDDEARYSSAVLDSYKALTLAGEKLFITFTGEKENASEYVADIAKHFGTELVNIDNLDALYMIESVRSAEKQYVINTSQLTDGRKKAVEAVLSEKDSGTIDRIKNVISNNGGNSDIHRISDIAPIVFPQTALSPTAIEKLNGCKFAYFLRYGMNLSSSASIAMNASNYGNIMHYIMKFCFERMYSGAKESGNPCVPDDDIKQLIQGALADYREKYLLAEESMSARFNTLYNALSVTAFYLIKYMAHELENSKFVPSYFELKLESGKSDNGFDISPYSFDIELTDGTRQTITVGGTVDRVDIAYNEDGNGGQIRVIDYKTGDRDAKISHIYYGLDLQLLLYLFTLAKNNGINGFTPSSALYHPSGKTSLKDVKAPSEELKRGIWLSEHKEKGFAVEGTQQDVERTLYNGLKLDKDKQTNTNFYSAITISDAKLEKLESRIEKVVKENTEQVKSGVVDAKPLVDDGKAISCKYCEYRDICGMKERSCVEVNSAEATDFEEDIIVAKAKKGKGDK